MLECNKGELVYVPSQVRLHRYFDTMRGIMVKDFLTLEEPKTLLVVEAKQEKEVGVHFRGEVWYVDRKDIFREE